MVDEEVLEDEDETTKGGRGGEGVRTGRKSYVKFLGKNMWLKKHFEYIYICNTKQNG